MSGTLATLATVGGIGTAVSDFLFGGDTVTLGDFEFQNFELPERMPFGGDHQLTVHKLPGGARVVDAMGPDPVDISWSGIFLGGNALLRAQTVDAIRVAGQPVLLSWRNFLYLVVVRSFTPMDKQPGWVPYSISCTVLEDQSQPAQVSLLSVAEQVYADVNSVLGLVSVVTNGPTAPTDATVAAQTALTGNQIKSGSTDQATAVASLQTAQAALQAARDAAGTTLDATPVSSVAALSTVLTQSGVAATMTAAAGYAGRAVANAQIGSS